MSVCCPWLSRLAVLFFAVCISVGATTFFARTPTVADEPQAKLLRHVVMFKFKDSASAADVEKIVAEFRALPTKIKEIAAFEYGTNNSPEGLADGFTHCFFVSFKDEQGRAAYLPHAAHLEFVSHLKPHLDKALVVDYWAAK